jgi:hypothetical protein
MVHLAITAYHVTQQPRLRFRVFAILLVQLVTICLHAYHVVVFAFLAVVPAQMNV